MISLLSNSLLLKQQFKSKNLNKRLYKKIQVYEILKLAIGESLQSLQEENETKTKEETQALTILIFLNLISKKLS